MKKRNYILINLLVLVTLIFYKGTAQENLDENIYFINQYFQLNKQTHLNLENKEPTTNNRITPQNNFVNLQQVGNNNVIDIKQKGNDTQTINQLGYKNYYNFINYYNSSPLNLNILQLGNSNNLQIYGQNSLINNMSIVQKSNFKTIIIKNH